MDIIKETFNIYFPNKTIKDIQYTIIKELLSGNDVLAILPTGYGKSLCYQMPFLLNQNKVVIVISPLISLMEDQKEKLEQMNIPVACFHSGIGKKEKADIKMELLDTGMIIFLTPEYIINCETWIKQLIYENLLLMVAFDEAHCISTWGNDFRPEYQGLYRIKDWIKETEIQIPLIALTATATKTVENDIKTLLQLENAKIFKTSFDRPNLIISVKQKTKDLNILCPILDKYKNDYSIIYCRTRDKAEELAEYLKNKDYNADVYHAGLKTSDRLIIQTKFSNKELNIIVATVAFGMGIDQTIHLVIHWGCPSDMESYYQEIGRAGRDGAESDCYLFFDKQDFKLSRFFLKSITNAKHKLYRDEQISMMERYCMLDQCRRKMILAHFGENLNSCIKCDNCMNSTKISINVINQIMYPILILMKTILSIKYKLGITKIYLIVKGSKSKSIIDFITCKTYGLLKNYTEDQIKTIINILILNDYLREKTISSGFGSILETTTKLISWNTLIKNKINNNLSFDTTYDILIDKDNILTLNIPHELTKNVTNIKIKTTAQEILDEFNE